MAKDRCEPVPPSPGPGVPDTTTRKHAWLWLHRCPPPSAALGSSAFGMESSPQATIATHGLGSRTHPMSLVLGVSVCFLAGAPEGLV